MVPCALSAAAFEMFAILPGKIFRYWGREGKLYYGQVQTDGLHMCWVWVRRESDRAEM